MRKAYAVMTILLAAALAETIVLARRVGTGNIPDRWKEHLMFFDLLPFVAAILLCAFGLSALAWLDQGKKTTNSSSR